MPINRVITGLQRLAGYAPGGTTSEDPVLKVLAVAGDGTAAQASGGTAPQQPDCVVPPGSPWTYASTGDIATIDTKGYDTLAVHIYGIGNAGNTIQFLESNDNANWITKYGDREDNLGALPGDGGGTISVNFRCTMRYVKFTCTSYVAGAMAFNAILRAAPSGPKSVTLTNQPYIRMTGYFGQLLSQFAFRTTTAAAANPALIKGSMALLFGYTFANTSTAWRFVHLFNKAAAPVPGTDSDTRVIPIPPGGVVTYNAGDIGINFSAGLGIAVTTAPAANDGTVANIAVNDVTGMVDYA